jgi:hypothetical protein
MKILAAESNSCGGMNADSVSDKLFPDFERFTISFSEIFESKACATISKHCEIPGEESAIV